MKIERLTYTNEYGKSVEFSHASDFFLEGADGIAGVRAEIARFSAMGQDGDTLLGCRIEARDIELSGHLRAKGKAAALGLRRELTRALNPLAAGVLTYEYGDFRREIYARPLNSPEYDPPDDVFVPFTAAFVCLDPFWREPEATTDFIGLWEGKFEFPLEIDDEAGFEFEVWNPGLIVNAYNGGDAHSYITLEVIAFGTVINPRLVMVETQAALRFDGLTLADGDRLLVSTYYGQKSATVTRADGTAEDVFRYIDPDSVFIKLAPGDNFIKYDADYGRENVEAFIIHHDRYLGV